MSENVKDASSQRDKIVIVACSVMKPELEAILRGNSEYELRYLDSRLHDTPKKIPALLQQEVDAVEPYASRIVLGYGFCSNGIAGIRAPRQGIYVPKAHDCIALFLGSTESYDFHFKAKPGTYYLTPGWMEENRDPLGHMEKDYVPKMGRKKAELGTKLTFKDYTHIALIDTGVTDVEPLRRVAKDNARFLEKRYEEIVGTHEFFKKILFGPYDERNFMYFKAGEKIAISF